MATYIHPSAEVGNPAQLIDYVCKCGERLPADVDRATYECDHH